MKHLYIKSIAASALALATVVNASAQDLTSYFMPDAVESKNHNAAFAPDRGYVTVPVVGAISLSTSGNLSLGDLIYPMGDELVPILDTRVSWDQAKSGLQDVNNFGLENRLSILGFGAYCKDRKSFWSFDINLRTSANIAMPYEFFEFFKTAPESSSIEDVNIYMESYAEAAFGYSKVLSDKLTVGGRVKFLAGLMNAELNIDRMDLTLTSDQWAAEASGTLNINAKGMEVAGETNEDGVETYELGDLDYSPSGISGIGAAIDFGATYELTDRIQLSASVNDIGFIRWGADSNTSASVANNFDFSGANIDVNDDGTESDPDDSGVNFDDVEFVAENSKANTKWLQANVNAGVEYSMFGRKLNVGGVYSARFWESKTVHNFTTAVVLSPLEWISFAASYAITNNSANAVGFAVNLLPGFVNLYLATDILTSKKSAQLVPIEQSMMNVSFGLAVPLGRGERTKKISYSKK